MTRFVVDGGQWQFNGWQAHQLEDALEGLLDRIDIAFERDEEVAYGEDLFNDQVLGRLTFWDLFAPDSPLPLGRDLQVRVSSIVDRLGRWTDGTDWPAALDVEVGGVVTTNPDVAYAHSRVASREPVACLGLLATHVLGPRTVTCAGQTTSVHWVCDEPSHVAFFRDAIDVEGDNGDTVRRLAAHAWPTLYFHPGTWTFGEFAGGYSRVAKALRKSLDVLADHGAWILTAPGSALRESDSPSSHGRPPDIVQQRFVAYGMTVAPEHADVKATKKCREARECEVQGRTLYCEWHVKLEPYENRVHLHPPVPESGGRTVIARFHRHLPLPGD